MQAGFALVEASARTPSYRVRGVQEQIRLMISKQCRSSWAIQPDEGVADL
jgi:hypothetical protein